MIGPVRFGSEGNVLPDMVRVPPALTVMPPAFPAMVTAEPNAVSVRDTLPAVAVSVIKPAEPGALGGVPSSCPDTDDSSTDDWAVMLPPAITVIFPAEPIGRLLKY